MVKHWHNSQNTVQICILHIYFQTLHSTESPYRLHTVQIRKIQFYSVFAILVAATAVKALCFNHTSDLDSDRTDLLC